jgi:TrwC relaxase
VISSASDLGHLTRTEHGRFSPAGTWTGRGCPRLGLPVGSQVDNHVIERLYGKLIDPRDPSGDARLGKDDGAVEEREMAAEPEHRPAAHFFDVTVAVPTSVSLLWVELSDKRGVVEEWFWDCVMAAAGAGMAYLQDKASCATAGTSGHEQAHDWVIGSFRHATLNVNAKVHVHNAVLGFAVRSENLAADSDAWCPLDRELVLGFEPDADAIASRVLRTELESHGVRTVELPDRSGWETERYRDERERFEQWLREPRDPSAEWPPPNQKLTAPQAITLAAIAGVPDMWGEQRPIFSNEIVRKLAEAGIAVDNGWVMGMGAGLTLKHLVAWRRDPTGDLGRASYTITPAGRRWLQVNVEDA